MEKAVTEADIVRSLGAAFTDRLHIDLRKNPIHIRMEDNAIVLEGMVESVALKKRALLIAMGIEGTSGVIDRLRVKPSSKMTDQEIKAHTLDTLRGEQTLSGCDITVDVKDGVVDLEGTVPSLSHKRLAGALAWWVPGSVDVINSLEVEPPEEDSDEEVRDAVKLVLDKDRVVDAVKVLVRSRNWVVTLEGVVGSPAEKEAAEEDAWYIWGVNDVVNKLTVR